MVRRTPARMDIAMLPQFTAGDCEMSQTEPANHATLREGRYAILEI